MATLRRVAAAVALDDLHLRVQVDIVDRFTVEHHARL
jgi:hypothetical protein